MRRSRRRTVGLLVAGCYAAITAVGASPAAADNEPTGLGGLIVGPDLRRGQGSQTLYEAVPPSRYELHSNFGLNDLADKAITPFLNMLLALLITFVRGCIVLTQWVFNLNLWPDMSVGVGNAVDGLADAVFWPVLPVVLAIGALSAWAGHRRDGTGVSDLAWLVATAVIGISFVTHPVRYLSGLDGVRQAVASGVMTGLSGGVTTGSDGPVQWPALDEQGSEKNIALRKASDSIWRTYVVTPWCMADLGSLEACQTYGAFLLTTDGDFAEDRILEGIKEKSPDETDDWVDGHNLAGRAGILLLALLTAVPFAVLLLFLALAALIAAFTAIALGILGPLFLLLWPMRGRPRQIGVRWIEALVGAVVQGVAVTAVLGVTLVISSLIMRLSDIYGYFLMSLLNIAATLTAFRYRRMLENILGVAMPGAASPLVGMAAAYGAHRLARRVTSGWRLPRWNHMPAMKWDRPPGKPGRTRPSPNWPTPSRPPRDRSPIPDPLPSLPGMQIGPQPAPITAGIRAKTGQPHILAAPTRTAVGAPVAPRPLSAAAHPARAELPAGTPESTGAAGHHSARPAHGRITVETPTIRHTPDLPPGPPSRGDRRRPRSPGPGRGAVRRSLPPVIEGNVVGAVRDVRIDTRPTTRRPRRR